MAPNSARSQITPSPSRVWCVVPEVARVELVDAFVVGEDSEFLKSCLSFWREEGLRVELFLRGVGYAEIEENPRAAVLEEDFVSADFVDVALERGGCCVFNHAFLLMCLCLSADSCHREENGW